MVSFAICKFIFYHFGGLQLTFSSPGDRKYYPNQYSQYPVDVPTPQPPGTVFSVYTIPPPRSPIPGAVQNPGPSQSRKRSARSGNSKRAKKARTDTVSTNAGAGPSIRSIPRARPTPEQIDAESSVLPPSYTPDTGDDNPAESSSSRDPNIVHELWLHIIGTTFEKKPDNNAFRKLQEQARIRLDSKIGDLRRPVPEAEHPRLLCIQCLLIGQWKTWKNASGGITTGIRTHLETIHPIEYREGCAQLGKPTQEFEPDLSDDVPPEPITTDGIARYVAELIAEQDLAFNFAESRAFRRLLCYVGQKSQVKSADLPKRHTVTRMAMHLSSEAKERIKRELKHACGRVSITSDLWTDEMERPFMAVTGHFINANKMSVVVLLAFRFVDGSHDGPTLARHLFAVLEEYKIVDKVGSITLDNASNNDTMMEALQERMHAEGYVDFEMNGNRVRCFPHIINLAVNAFLDALGGCSAAYLDKAKEHGYTPSDKTLDYLEALDTRPDLLCHDIVVALRSGQRRRGLQQTIREGNEKGLWVLNKDLDENDSTGTARVLTLRQLQLLLDVKTRWSSKWNMIARFLYLWPAVKYYLNKNWETFPQFGGGLSSTQFKVLQDIQAVLDIPHRAQELLSADQTPCLSLAFPVYEQLIINFENAQARFPALESAIGAAIGKLQEYKQKSRTSPIHVLAMVLNPSVKYSLIDKYWTEEERKNARVIVTQFMLAYAEAHDSVAQYSSNRDMVSSGAQAQFSGLSTVFGWDDLSGGQEGNFGSTVPSASPIVPRIASLSSSALPPSSPLRPDSTPVRARSAAQRSLSVELEHEKYVNLGLWDLKRQGPLDLVKYWTTQGTPFSYLNALAMDVLPAQASSVSSEQV
ncbi:AC9 transposase, putative, partial [Rhizoctonia solani AG-3 Rhs1AP]